MLRYFQCELVGIAVGFLLYFRSGLAGGFDEGAILIGALVFERRREIVSMDIVDRI